MSCGCQCQGDQLYEVIGLCDVSKINIEGQEAWTQLSLPEVLTIPNWKPCVEGIDKVFVNVKIISKKVIETPPKPPTLVENAEGTTLTGKKLIVEGILCEKIVYTADEPQQSVHSAHFEIPFSSFIVINGDTDLNDKYCVETCIEDVYAKVLNCREIFTNVTLFLRAKECQSTC